MAGRKPGASAKILDEGDIDESLWDSPAKPAPTSNKQQSGNAAQSSKPTHENQEGRDQALRQELANVRKVNETIEGVIQALDKAKTNLRTVNQTVGAASSLLNTWMRILSQTEHNQRLILDPSWQGASQDVVDMEAEAVAKQQAAVRRDAEEQERRNDATRKVEEDERRRAVEGPKQQRTTSRGRARVTSRGASASQSGYVGDTTTIASSSARGSTGQRRTGTGIGQGRGGRGRG